MLYIFLNPLYAIKICSNYKVVCQNEDFEIYCYASLLVRQSIILFLPSK